VFEYGELLGLNLCPNTMSLEKLKRNGSKNGLETKNSASTELSARSQFM
jgi:hypothetical protein